MISESIESTNVDLTEYIFLVEVVARKFHKKFHGNFERIQDTELYSIASVELVKAAASYNPTINEDFGRYAFRVMRNGIIESIRYRNRQKRTADFCKLNDLKWQEVPEKKQTLKVPAYETMQQICKKLIENQPEDTPQDRIDKTILSEVYVEGKNVSDVAKKNKITRVTVYNRLSRIIKKIQKQHSDLIYLHREILE